MIPKIIHYCWFGHGQKTATILKCIESWKKYFPDWEIIEWNEDNFDINCNTYVRQAYAVKKWAFVSDYVRFWALKKYGGIYFDTDVEVIRSFKDILNKEAFVGFETDEFVNPGQVLYCKEPENNIINKTIEWYNQAHFLDDNGIQIHGTVCIIFTEILNEYGFKPTGELQTCGNFTIFPKDYFCPFDDSTGVLKKTENTHSIHWYDKSWMPLSKILRNKITRIIHRYLGTDIKKKILKIFKKHHSN